ncbi:retinoblastoma family protein-like isoform X2 [Toxorhynchites rutilus septentrionalis]|uniref:retinoblastoma family protein-like isoform X2 n=1 Tax=Toxorhynchites rutilus septentrionalis TaxID=329112 RepID=UPI00247A1CC7|nr:retinoblastoma family protein-like isoform X2 [Toxorhynchites rutilus septentrionalis]
MTNQSDGEALRAEHRAICERLNIDGPTEERSWNSFRDIRKSYNLDGEQLHWLCCSLYVTCRQTVTPTVGNTNSVLRGNCVSLTRLLRLCNINLHEFFNKITHWIEMASLPEEHRSSIGHLQHSFAVSMSIYNKYCEVFTGVFLPPNADEQKRSKKSKPLPCSPNRLHEFCWTLFICAKAEYPEQSIDLVTSYNMLLCCLDLVYANAIAAGRKDIVNPDFEGLPKGFAISGEAPEQPVCIIEAMCEEGCSSDVVNTKNTSWKDVIEKLFHTKVLKGDVNSFMELISVTNFDDNLKALNGLYDTFILSCGEFDERIALGQKLVENALASRIKSEQPASTGTPERMPLCRQTPLSGRNRISSNECNKFTPISTANASVNKLRMKLMGYDKEPLRELFKSCVQDPKPIVMGRVAAEREKFLNRMRGQNWNQKSTAAKFDMIEALYYKLLENIIRAEMRRRPNNIVRELCCEDMFNKTLLVCSAEIVIYAHNLQQNFPWILNAFDMPPFIFYRIIEMVILNHNDLLSRDLIKHLTIIEEQCLETLCWISSSPLWVTMDNISYKVPTSQDVESSTDLSGITPHKPGDSVSKSNDHVRLDSTPSTSTVTNAAGSTGRKIPNPESAKKRLFKMDDDEPKPTTSGVAPDDRTGNSTDSESSKEKKEQPKESIGPRSNLNQPFLATLGFNSPLKLPVPNGSLSKRRPGAGSLGLFFRKFYTLAAVRMKHLCVNLNLTTMEIQKQIWTIFEYSIVHCTKDLMRDRHLDQMLMCAIYVFVKIKKLNKTFTDIMKYYRSQPQANSHVYRSVFITRLTPEQVEQQRQQQNGINGNPKEESHRIPPTDLAGVSVQHGVEERGDIILFYNTVYVKLMQDFAIQFGNVDERSLILSPPPKTPNRSVLLSPKQVDGRISLYVTPMDRKSDLKESPNSITFMFDRSPAKDLEEINRIVKNTNISSCKRSLSDPDSYDHPGSIKAMRKCKKWDRLISDRQQQESK